MVINSKFLILNNSKRTSSLKPNPIIEMGKAVTTEFIKKKLIEFEKLILKFELNPILRAKIKNSHTAIDETVNKKKFLYPSFLHGLLEKKNLYLSILLKFTKIFFNKLIKRL